MSDAALETEIARLRDQVAKLEAARPSSMEGFQRLNDAIIDNRLGAFLVAQAQPRWFRIAVPIVVVAVPLAVLTFLHFA